ncbi:MAG: ATP-binding cassette domain-containing protein [Candidatus Tectomicrobia bacterium]|uniref:ATP-binding cassette domain-containing protein n=1 Tax=Tectimicrobiota bacterium TaxID=2528274 RepID=A0A933LQU1_UNCTE|nr:ATP-binding cassette domain-containing protein [Candidatus Tectomicrobia bacterium]
MNENLLEVRNLVKHFPVRKGLIFQHVKGWIKAVDGVTFSILKGKTFGLVGESGCGKTTTSKLILLLEKATSGSILFKGKEVQSLNREGLKEYRRSVQVVFQDPYSSLSPRMQVGDIIAEPLVVNESFPRSVVKTRVKELLTTVGLSSEAASLFPHEFSGGQRQRIAIARALALKVDLIILDEPVSALDVSIRAQIMNLLMDLQDRLGLSYLLIAHDLGVVTCMSDIIAVMYLGKIVELAPAKALATSPRHPYTKALFSAALPSHPDEYREEILLSGEVTSPLNPPSGCRFRPRCGCTEPLCLQKEPLLRLIDESRYIACHLF